MILILDGADAIWEAGIESVAAEIEKTRTFFDLAKRFGGLDTALRRATANGHGSGGNNPSEMLDDSPIAKELVIFWGAVARSQERS